MPHLPYASFFALPLTLLYLGLAINIIRHRYRLRAAIGDQNDSILRHAIRAHANCGEYVPLWLLLFALLELQGGLHWLLGTTGALFLTGRCLHAYSLLVRELVQPDFRFRMAGMALTFTAYGICLAALFGTL